MVEFCFASFLSAGHIMGIFQHPRPIYTSILAAKMDIFECIYFYVKHSML